MNFMEKVMAIPEGVPFSELSMNLSMDAQQKVMDIIREDLKKSKQVFIYEVDIKIRANVPTFFAMQVKAELSAYEEQDARPSERPTTDPPANLPAGGSQKGPKGRKTTR